MTCWNGCPCRPDPVREKGLVFEVSVDETVPRYVVGDVLRLRQVLLNLISNAIKFTERGSVVVRVKVTDMTRGGSGSDSR